MDDRSFDRLARLLGEARDRRSGLKALAGGILGAAGVAALDADADAKRKGKDRKHAGPDAGKKKRKTCKPACEAGFTCEKVGRKRVCVCGTGVICGESCCALGQSCVAGECRAAACDPPCANGYVCEGTACVCPSGVECGEACCAAGQTCQDGACAGQPDPDRCLAAGQPCKATGRACCDGRVCASGQGGEPDVACYVPKTGACATTADCVFGTSCVDGRCAPLPPPPPTPIGQLGAACNPQTNVCTSPGTVCQPYTGDHPAGLSGTYCTLPLQAVCTGDPDCGCYRCEYAAETVPGAVVTGRRGRATAATTCCNGLGETCGSNRDCCEGTACEDGACVAAACDVCAGGGCAYATIEEAITRSSADNLTEIRIAGGTYAEYDLPMPGGASITLRNCSAAPVIIDARERGRIMVPIASGKTITIKGITVRNGKAEPDQDGFALGNGGAFKILDGATLALDGATAIGPKDGSGDPVRAASSGGCIHSEGRDAELDIRGSTISGWMSGGYGGGIYSEFYAAVSITDSTIADNVADTVGGGIVIEGGNPTLENVTVSGNRAGFNGGGVRFTPKTNGEQITLTNCTISGNVASGNNGGGLDFRPAFSSDSGSKMVITGGTFDGNQGPQGGAISIAYGNLELSGARIVNNTATATGGGIYTDLKSVNTALITGNTLIEGNQAGPAGGGIYFDREQNYVATISGNVAIRGNRVLGATGEGGGVFLNSTNGVSNNGSLTVKDNVVIEGNTATKGAGIMLLGAGPLTLEGSVRIRNNVATGAGAVSGVQADKGVTATSATVTCSGTPRSCGNPANATATGATNCGGDGDFNANCDAMCVGKGNSTPGSGACPA